MADPGILFTLMSHDGALEVLEVLGLDAFAAGKQPHARQADFEQLKPEASLLPDRPSELWTSEKESQRCHLARGEGWTLWALRRRDRTGSVRVTAVSADLASAVLAEATQNVEDPAQEGTVSIGFWYYSSAMGPTRHVRPITAPTWQSIRGNYAKDVAESIDQLSEMTPEDVYGRLVLLHGAPGTGKTTALRALAHEWRDWCQVDCVLDPDQLFDKTDYLMEAVVGEEDVEGDGDGNKWRLLLLEDCDELIRGEAKQSTGQALSRLLNLTDGMLGQGRDVLVAITTNEDLGRLHPAVIRPGRCIAHIEVGTLPYPQAVSWLGEAEGVPAGGATLAELYALRSGHPPEKRSTDGGFYL